MELLSYIHVVGRVVPALFCPLPAPWATTAGLLRYQAGSAPSSNRDEILRNPAIAGRAEFGVGGVLREVETTDV